MAQLKVINDVLVIKDASTQGQRTNMKGLRIEEDILRKCKYESKFTLTGHEDIE